MKIEDLEKRLADLEKETVQLMANYNALLGAKQECLFWLKQLKNKVEVEA